MQDNNSQPRLKEVQHKQENDPPCFRGAWHSLGLNFCFANIKYLPYLFDCYDEKTRGDIQ